MLGDEVMAAALLDRLLHRCLFASTGYPSYGATKTATVRTVPGSASWAGRCL